MSTGRATAEGLQGRSLVQVLGQSLPYIYPPGSSGASTEEVVPTTRLITETRPSVLGRFPGHPTRPLGVDAHIRRADEILSFSEQRSSNWLTLLGSWSHECTQGHDGKEPGM